MKILCSLNLKYHNFATHMKGFVYIYYIYQFVILIFFFLPFSQIESEFNITIPDETADGIKTVQEVIDYLVQLNIKKA